MGTANQTDSTSSAACTRRWLIVSVAAIGWGTLTITVLHLISSHNPVLDTLSSYAFTDRGSGMLGASMLSLAVGSLAILGALDAAGISISRTAGTLFFTWSLGLATAAVFPASYATNPHPVSGEIHQYSCLVAFLSVPGIGFSVLEKVADRSRATLDRLTWYTVAGIALFGTSYLLAAFPGTPVIDRLSAVLPVGLSQRIALATDLALLVWLMVLASRTCSAGSGDGRLRPVAVEAGEAAGVHEDDVFVGAELAATRPLDQRGRGLAVVNGLEHDPFGTPEKP
jgi:hypothetical protein